MAAFVKELLAGEAAAPGRADVVGEWRSLAGSAHGSAVAEEVQRQLFPLWTQPADTAGREAMARAVAGLSSLDASAVRVSLDGGRASALVQLPGQAQRTVVLQAVLHPAVVRAGGPGGTVLCRTEEGVVAYEAASGRVVWQNSLIPLHQHAP